MDKITLRDLIIILPGITGSVLQKDGADIWPPYGNAFWNMLFSMGNSLQDLALDDDPDADELDDGITAVRLVPDLHLIPGLVKIDGYTGLRRFVANSFSLSPGNVLEFPYDWRRSNRVSARKLKRFVDQHLAQWRSRGARDAKVIFLAHSMGGLIARYYLEVLDGWHDCRALVTFGTPYRGSLNALNFLANGYNRWFVDLSAAMRSFTSIYELLPIYEVLATDGEHRRIADVKTVPNVSHHRAQEALSFHRAIEAAEEQHRRKSGPNRYAFLPYIGIHQPTNQSAHLASGHLVVSQNPLPQVPHALQGGDGTVPLVSAIPIELSANVPDTFIAERHSSLQNNLVLLNRLGSYLGPLTTSAELAKLRGGGLEQIGPAPGLAVDIDDGYSSSEPIILRASIVGAADPTQSGGVEAVLQSAGQSNIPDQRFTFHPDGGGWTLTIPPLPPGIYRIRVHTVHRGPGMPSPVHDVFVVAPKSPL